jgi:hypothetical protein
MRKVYVSDRDLWQRFDWRDEESNSHTPCYPLAVTLDMSTEE